MKIFIANRNIDWIYQVQGKERIACLFQALSHSKLKAAKLLKQENSRRYGMAVGMIVAFGSWLGMRYGSWSTSALPSFHAQPTEIPKIPNPLNLTKEGEHLNDRPQDAQKIYQNISLNRQNSSLNSPNDFLNHHYISLNHQNSSLNLQNSSLYQQNSSFNHQNNLFKHQNSSCNPLTPMIHLREFVPPKTLEDLKERKVFLNDTSCPSNYTNKIETNIARPILNKRLFKKEKRLVSDSDLTLVIQKSGHQNEKAGQWIALGAGVVGLAVIYMGLSKARNIVSKYFYGKSSAMIPDKIKANSLLAYSSGAQLKDGHKIVSHETEADEPHEEEPNADRMTHEVDVDLLADSSNAELEDGHEISRENEADEPHEEEPNADRMTHEVDVDFRSPLANSLVAQLEDGHEIVPFRRDVVESKAPANVNLTIYEKYQKELLFSKRPEAVQKKIDEVHALLKNEKVEDAWSYRGDSGFYNLLNFRDTDVISQRIEQAKSNKKDLYFIDLGAGQFAWVDALQNFLSQKYEGDERRFHVIGVTGEGGLSHEIKEHKNVITHKINGFKLENLLESFNQLGLHLEDSVEFIVCSWTLRHLVDPVGTLDQAYHLLDRGNGFLFGTGFYPFNPKHRLYGVLEAAFGRWNFFARATSEHHADLDQFALFRDIRVYTNAKENINYNEYDPIVEMPGRMDAYSQGYANIFFDKNLTYKWNLGGDFYAASWTGLRKLIGEDQHQLRWENNIFSYYLFKDEPHFLELYLKQNQHKPYFVSRTFHYKEAMEHTGWQ